MSAFRCAHCGQSPGIAEYISRHVCGACGRLQPVASREDFFHALGVEQSFNLDRGALERRFYEISRALHPDRFTTAGSESQKLSLERMSLVNRAYRTLRDPEALRQYFLELEGVSVPKSGAPQELAESWFELQDAVMDAPEQGARKFAEFAEGLKKLEVAAEERLKELERQIDAARADGSVASYREGLEALAGKIQEQSYIKSMERDVERMRIRFVSHGSRN